MELIQPSLKYETSFREGIAEFNTHDIPGFLNDGQPLTDVEAYIEKTKRQSDGVGLPEGWVPSSTFWLIDGDEYIGHINIRHMLNESLLRRGGTMGYAIRPSKRGRGYGSEMLRLALQKAKDLKIGRALITCNKENIASRTIIEKNGGVLQDEIIVDEKPILRFWIED